MKDTQPLSKSSAADMPVMIVAGLGVLLLTAIALPLGSLALAGLAYLKFICRPLVPASPSSEAVLAPAEGVIYKIEQSDSGLTMWMKQNWDSRLHIAMPVKGRIEQNLYVDGVYLSLDDPAAPQMNARREFMIETDEGQHIELVQWASPFGRLQLSSVLEGQMVAAGSAIALNLFGSVIALRLPAGYAPCLKEGAYCMAGQTILAEHQRGASTC